MFVQAQVEDHGAGFVAGYYQRLASHATDVPPPTTAWLLDQQIKAVSGGTESLSTRFAAYARDVWDPTRWTTGAIRRLRDEYGLQPASYLYRRDTQDSGWQQIGVAHLAARYVEVKNDESAAAPATRSSGYRCNRGGWI